MKNNIELRSQKVRNIIGSIPPIIVRIGHILIVYILVFLVFLAKTVEIPNELNCNLKYIKKLDDNIILEITSFEKPIFNKIPPNTPIEIFYKNKPIFESKLISSIDSIRLSENIIITKSIVNVNNKNIKIDIDSSTPLEGKIKLSSDTIWNYLFNF